MAVTETPRTLSAVGISDGLFMLASRFHKWREARRTRAVLSQLSDRELDDIGLTRGDIDHIRI